jgi:hypothetical protein
MQNVKLTFGKVKINWKEITFYDNFTVHISMDKERIAKILALDSAMFIKPSSTSR